MNGLIYNIIALFSFDCAKLKARFSDMDKKISDEDERQKRKNFLIGATMMSDMSRIAVVGFIAAALFI